MIYLVLGKQGSGKTLFLIKKAYEAYKAGKTIYSNVALNFPFQKLSYKDIVNCKYDDALILIDEVHLLLPARRAMRRANREICDGFLSMARKKRVEIYGTTQTPRKVDIRFYEEADYLIRCSKFGFINRAWRRVNTFENQPLKVPIMISYEILDTFDGASVSDCFIANNYYSMYDTRQIIKVGIIEGRSEEL